MSLFQRINISKKQKLLYSNQELSEYVFSLRNLCAYKTPWATQNQIDGKLELLRQFEGLVSCHVGPVWSGSRQESVVTSEGGGEINIQRRLGAEHSLTSQINK